MADLVQLDRTYLNCESAFDGKHIFLVLTLTKLKITQPVFILIPRYIGEMLLTFLDGGHFVCEVKLPQREETDQDNLNL